MNNLNNLNNLNNIKNLVISGGGFNGYQFFGIIKYLEEKNVIENITKFVGVSMGAFICFLIIIGYKYSEIELFLIEFNFTKIFDLKLEKILSEENIKGLSNGSNFDKLIKKFLSYKNYDENITLLELFNKTNKSITIGVSNLSLDTVEYFNHENHPDIPAYKILRMSSCIPIFFEPVEYNNSFYLDGVLKDAFPIQLIPDEELPITIGIFLQTTKEKYDIPNMSSTEYLVHLYRTLMSEHMKIKINKYKCLLKLFILNPITNSYNYQIDKNTRHELIEFGYKYCLSTIESTE
jgi:NTE family protein